MIKYSYQIYERLKYQNLSESCKKSRSPRKIQYMKKISSNMAIFPNHVATSLYSNHIKTQIYIQ